MAADRRTKGGEHRDRYLEKGDICLYNIYLLLLTKFPIRRRRYTAAQTGTQSTNKRREPLSGIFLREI
jgi:hypothetical protein